MCFHISFGQISKEIPIKQSTSYILFETAKFDLDAFSKHTMDSIYTVWKDSNNYRIYFYGNTDSVGDKNYNLILSNNRVASVGNYLHGLGVDTSKIKYASYGENKPKYNNDEAHKHLNRRVDIVIRYSPTIPPPQKTGKKKTFKKISKLDEAKKSVEIVKQEKDTVLWCGKTMMITLPLSYYNSLIDSGYDFKCNGCHCYGYFNLLYKGQITDKCLDRNIKFTFYVHPGRTPDKVLDTFTIYNLDKKGNRVGKINPIKPPLNVATHKITFSTKCFWADTACCWQRVSDCPCTGPCERHLGDAPPPIGLFYTNIKNIYGISLLGFRRTILKYGYLDGFKDSILNYTYGAGIFFPFKKFDSTRTSPGLAFQYIKYKDIYKNIYPLLDISLNIYNIRYYTNNFLNTRVGSNNYIYLSPTVGFLYKFYGSCLSASVGYGGIYNINKNKIDGGLVLKTGFIFNFDSFIYGMKIGNHFVSYRSLSR